ncbi:MAG: hypothetical protein QNK23_15205 [Crocinitomicaceae bacterium]|nr:hypothetical protein [Crocinitomicaceae bacterium]
MIFTSTPLLAQKGYTISYENESYQQFIKHPKVKFKDSISAIQYLNDFQLSAISKGFIMASVDSVHYSTGHANVYFELGPEMEDVSLSTSPEDLRFIRKHSRITEKLITQIPFTPIELSSTLRKIQKAYLDNGYPFVALQLVNNELIDGQLSAELQIERGPFLNWQKIHVKGDSTISSKYMSNLLGIKIGDAYSEEEVHKISERVDQIPFIKEIKSAEMLFTKEGVELYLYLESLPISSVNGVLGFQPNPTTKKLEFTGEISLKLQDVLHRGELLDVKWQSIRAQTQSLDAHVNYPFFFNTPFGIDATFNLYKRDTSFLELGVTAGVQYFLNRGNFLKAFYRYSSSSVLAGGANNPLFSNLGHVKTNNYGLSFTSNRVDYIPNPSRGLKILVEGSIGTRSSQLNDTSIVEKAIVYRGKLNVEYYIPIFKRHVLRLSSQTDFYSSTNLYENEVYRYGGLKSQRGFNEDELFATTKTTATIEYRFLLDKNSHVFAFFDQSWYENNASDYYNDTPFGFGLGFSFSTKFGVFSISYALGKQLNNRILFSNSKVHFGYILYF